MTHLKHQHKELKVPGSSPRSSWQCVSSYTSRPTHTLGACGSTSELVVHRNSHWVPFVWASMTPFEVVHTFTMIHVSICLSWEIAIAQLARSTYVSKCRWSSQAYSHPAMQCSSVPFLCHVNSFVIGGCIYLVMVIAIRMTVLLSCAYLLQPGMVMLWCSSSCTLS